MGFIDDGLRAVLAALADGHFLDLLGSVELVAPRVTMSTSVMALGPGASMPGSRMAASTTELVARTVGAWPRSSRAECLAVRAMHTMARGEGIEAAELVGVADPRVLAGRVVAAAALGRHADGTRPAFDETDRQVDDTALLVATKRT